MAKESSIRVQVALRAASQSSSDSSGSSVSATGGFLSTPAEKRRHLRIDAFNNESVNALSFVLLIGPASRLLQGGSEASPEVSEISERLNCKVLDYSALGIGVEIELSSGPETNALLQSALQPGKILRYELRIGTLEPFLGRGLICSSLVLESGARKAPVPLDENFEARSVHCMRLGIKFFFESAIPETERSPDRRREVRFKLPHLIAPLAICNDPVRFGERLYLEICEISSSGMKAVMSASHGFVTPHMCLELVIRIPCFGAHHVFAQVTHVIHSSAWNQIQIGARFLMSGKDFAACLAQFVRVFLDQEFVKETEEKGLPAQKILGRKFSKGFVFEKEMLEKYFAGVDQTEKLSSINDPVCYVSKSSKLRGAHESSLFWRIGQAQFDTEEKAVSGSRGVLAGRRATGLCLSYTRAYGFLLPSLSNSKSQEFLVEEYFERCLIFSAINALVSSSQLLMFDFSKEEHVGAAELLEKVPAQSNEDENTAGASYNSDEVVSDLKHFLCDLGFHSTTFSDQVLYIETEALFKGNDVPVDLWLELVREALQVEPSLFQKIGRPALWRRLLLLVL